MASISQLFHLFEIKPRPTDWKFCSILWIFLQIILTFDYYGALLPLSRLYCDNHCRNYDTVVWSRYFRYYIISITNLSIPTKPRVRPLFCDIDERGNKTFPSMRYSTGAHKTHDFKGEACHGGKQAKDRLIVLVATNQTGSEKLPLLAIGKSANPRCFKKIKTLAVDYGSNKKAWMTGSVFEKGIRKLDRKYLLQGRSIVMTIDNCLALPQIKDLRAIRLEFLPPNTTNHTQPCDQGIINVFKHRYRAKVMRKYLQYIESESPSELK